MHLSLEEETKHKCFDDCFNRLNYDTTLLSIFRRPLEQQKRYDVQRRGTLPFGNRSTLYCQLC